MLNKRKIFDRVIDFIIYSAVFFVLDLDKDYIFSKRLLISLMYASIATLFRILLDPLIDRWRTKLKKKREDKRNQLDSNQFGS